MISCNGRVIYQISSSGYQPSGKLYNDFLDRLLPWLIAVIEIDPGGGILIELEKKQIDSIRGEKGKEKPRRAQRTHRRVWVKTLSLQGLISVRMKF
jgi:hypothetical protein